MKKDVLRRGRISIRDQNGFARIVVGTSGSEALVLRPQDLFDLSEAITAWIRSNNVQVVI